MTRTTPGPGETIPHLQGCVCQSGIGATTTFCEVRHYVINSTDAINLHSRIATFLSPVVGKFVKLQLNCFAVFNQHTHSIITDFYRSCPPPFVVSPSYGVSPSYWCFSVLLMNGVSCSHWSYLLSHQLSRIPLLNNTYFTGSCTA